MDLMSKYLGIMKGNQENIPEVFIATDATIPGINTNKLPISYGNKLVSTVDGQIDKNYIYANIPDKSDKTTPHHDDRLPDLKPIVSTQSSREWNREMQDLIEWYMAIPKPTGSFYLERHQHVVDTGKFFESLKLEIQTGPTGPRARTGALQSDLQRLKGYFSGEEKAGSVVVVKVVMAPCST